MSESASPDPVPPAPAPAPSSEVVFRMLTPIFKYAIDGATCFTHSGDHRGARFEINLRPYAPNLTDWDEVTEHATNNIRNMLLERAIHVSEHFGISAHFLLTDVFHPASGMSGATASTPECQAVHDAVVDALNLHSSGGLPHHETYTFQCPPSQHSGLVIRTPNSRQARYSHLGRSSELRSTDFNACRSTIDRLLSKPLNGNTTFENVLRLAMEYHRLSFTLERVDHAFLILMVAFEAMFKKKDEDGSNHAAGRIGRLLGAATKEDCSAITKEFDTGPDCFREIRNDIAHGDTSLSLATVTNKYTSLYRHVTAAIVKLLSLPAGSLDDTKDYYDEISRITKERYDPLPRR
jgi:hypothetical protein